MKIWKIIFISLIILAGMVLLLEIFSKIYKCEAIKVGPPSFICFESVLKPKQEKLLNDLRDKRLSGEKISKQEYWEAAKMLIFEVDPEKLGGYLNGIACSDYGYVRNDLPIEAKKFVMRHELEHLLQTGKERNREFSANFVSGKEYPLGLIQTIFFSIKNRVKYHNSSICYISSLWKTFKVYILPF